MDDFEKNLKNLILKEAEKIEKEVQADPFLQLTDADRKALELGRKLLTKDPEGTPDSE